VFPEPRLEEDERGEIKTPDRIKEESSCIASGWTDEKAGVVQHSHRTAPMQLIAQRGLPVYAGTGAPSKRTESSTGRLARP